MMDTIEKLTILTDNLPVIPRLSEFKQQKPGSSLTEYEVENGTCFSFGLLTQPEISVANTFISSGGKFPLHNHGETELIVVFEGRMQIKVNGERKTLTPGDCLKIEPDDSHDAIALEDTKFIAITIPYSKDFPHDERD